MEPVTRSRIAGNTSDDVSPTAQEVRYLFEAERKPMTASSFHILPFAVETPKVLILLTL